MYAACTKLGNNRLLDDTWGGKGLSLGGARIPEVANQTIIGGGSTLILAEMDIDDMFWEIPTQEFFRAVKWAIN